MEFDEILAKCGNSGRYQYMLLGLLGYIAFVSTLQLYSQNVIGFMPDHWCYHEKLENRSYDEIAQIYAKFDSPACTRLETIEDNGTATISDKACDRWIYKYDFGFRGMNMEVCLRIPYRVNRVIPKLYTSSTTGSATRPIRQEWVNPFTFLARCWAASASAHSEIVWDALRPRCWPILFAFSATCLPSSRQNF